MTAQRDRDGLSQLTDLMRDERVYQPEPAPEIDPDIRRHSRRRRLIVSGVAAVIVIALTTTYVTYCLNAPIGPASAESTLPVVAPGPAAEIAVPPEGVSAVTVSGGDEYLGDTSGIWQGVGPTKVRPIASISKLVTAMVVLEAKPLKGDAQGPTITFSKADHALYDKYYVLGATIASMPTGSTMSERHALETMLVPSASNYAEAIANWAFGSQYGFANAAKKWLAAHKLTHTTIVEPTGIDARNTSSPADLLALAKIAMADPVVAEIVAMPHLSIPDFEQMPNTNSLLGTNGITGLKTGTLKDSGSDLLFSATMPVGAKDPLTVTGVVLGGFSRESVNADVTDLLNSITAGFHDVPLASAGQEVGTYTTAWGDSATMVLATDAKIFTWSDTPITSTMQTSTITTGKEGQEVGSITWTAGPNAVTVPLVLRGSITPPDSWWRLTHFSQLGK